MTASRRGVVWPTALALAAFLVLIGLGTWQLQRLAWKEALIETIAARTTAAPLSVADAEAAVAAGDALYLRATATGTYDHAYERHLYQIGPDGPGWHVYTPLVLADGRELWVNRGYVPLDREDPATRPDSLVAGVVDITGLVRLPETKGLFQPASDPDANQWYWRDLAGMSAGTGREPLPFFLDAETGGDPGDVPLDGTTIDDLPNRHFGYMLTWYGIALTLVLVYVPFIRHRWKQAASNGADP